MAFDFLIFQDHYLLKPLPTLESFQRTGFMMMSNGFGAFFGVFSAELLSINFHQGGGTGIIFGFRLRFNYCDCFAVLFKHKHYAEDVASVSH
jgi:hypothetical protein